MNPMAETPDAEPLVERLRLIEAQPVEARAVAYDGLLAELRSALEAADERA